MVFAMRWFRCYTDIVDDDKVRLLAFEDRWHYVALLAMKACGLLDEDESDLRSRRIALKLGLTVREADEVRRRLAEVSLIADDWQPLAWDRRQYTYDDSKERVRRYRERQRDNAKDHVTACNGYVTVTVTGSETDTDTDTDKNTPSECRDTKRFKKPSLDDIRAYVEEKNLRIDPVYFHDYYESNGWRVGRNPMKDWRATVRKWSRSDAAKATGKHAGHGSLKQDLTDRSWAQ